MRPTSAEYHTLRGQVLGGVERSVATPSLAPPPSSGTQFQLASDSTPYHVLAIRCPGLVGWYNLTPA